MIVITVTIRSDMQRMFEEGEAAAGQIPGRTSPLRHQGLAEELGGDAIQNRFQFIFPQNEDTKVATVLSPYGFL
jgi:hypothetical protein